MDEGHARCPAVPLAGPKAAASLTGQLMPGWARSSGLAPPVAWASDGSAAGVSVAGRTPAGVPGRSSSPVRPVRFIRQADVAGHHFL
jgi:hypothetical protein